MASRVRRWVLLAGIAAATVQPAQAADDGWGNWQLLEENDTFARPGRGSDEFYTQGLRTSFTREPERTWRWAERVGGWWGRHFWGDTEFQTTSTLVIGENHFTPGVITTYDADPQDRPFAAVLYGGVRVEMQGTRKDAYQALELDVGVVGPPALGRPLQTGFHVLRQHRIPKGWPNQLGTEPMISALYTNRRQYGLGTPEGNIVDVTRDFGLMLGTLQTYPTVGATVRLGWRMTGMAASSGILTVAPSQKGQCRAKDGSLHRCPFEFGVHGGADGRYFVRNGFYDGSLIGGEPSVDKDRWVYDLRFGAYFRLHSWRISYTAIHRSREFSPVPASAKTPDGVHDFGSLSISREFTCEQCNRPDAERRFWTRDWLFEFGIGVGTLRLLPGTATERTTDGPSGRFGFAKGLTRHLMLGYEVTGQAREGPRDAPGNHSDTFLTTQAAVLGVRPFAGKPAQPGAPPEKRPLGTLRLRGGVGQAQAKLELTGADGLAFQETTEKGVAYTLGADYTFWVGDQLALGLNSTWSYLSIGKELFDRASFLSTAVVVQWRP